jgi:hypothetical protein
MCVWGRPAHSSSLIRITGRVMLESAGIPAIIVAGRTEERSSL